VCPSCPVNLIRLSCHANERSCHPFYCPPLTPPDHHSPQPLCICCLLVFSHPVTPPSLCFAFSCVTPPAPFLSSSILPLPPCVTTPRIQHLCPRSKGCFGLTHMPSARQHQVVACPPAGAPQQMSPSSTPLLARVAVLQTCFKPSIKSKNCSSTKVAIHCLSSNQAAAAGSGRHALAAHRQPKAGGWGPPAPVLDCWSGLPPAT
jgi:hypothetical protein